MPYLVSLSIDSFPWICACPFTLARMVGWVQIVSILVID